MSRVTNPNKKEQEEIDIVANSNNKIIFGECKWSTSKIEINALLSLQRKSLMFKQYNERKYILFSKTGFNTEVITQSKNDDITLVELQELYASLRFGIDGFFHTFDGFVARYSNIFVFSFIWNMLYIIFSF